MCLKKVGLHRFQGGRITKFFVLIRIIRGCCINLRVFLAKGVVKEGYVAANTQPVCDDSSFCSIAKMAIDVLLLSVRVGFCGRRQEFINAFIRIISRIRFSKQYFIDNCKNGYTSGGAICIAAYIKYRKERIKKQ